MVLSSKALKEFKTKRQKLLLSLLGYLGNDSKEPKYSEQIYLDLRSYQEKLSGKLPTNSKLLSELMKSPYKPLQSFFEPRLICSKVLEMGPKMTGALFYEK